MSASINKEFQEALKLEVAAYDKVHDELIKLVKRYEQKHKKKVQSKKDRLNQMLGDYQTENDAHEAYGWGYITENEYREIVAVLNGNSEKAEVDTVDIVMSRIFSHLASDTLKLYQTLKYESLSDEEKAAWDKQVADRKAKMDERKKKNRTEHENAEQDKSFNPVNNTHLCGNYNNPENQCEHLLYVNKVGATLGKKQLQQYYLYCTAGGKCRSLGCVATFTGNSPTWCPKRVASRKK